MDRKPLPVLLIGPKRSKNPFGEIVDILGYPGENDTEMHSILAEFELPIKFSPEVEAYAEQIPDGITAEEIKKRRDFRKVPTFTIDPADAKDFDDALSLAVSGGWIMGGGSTYCRCITLCENQNHSWTMRPLTVQPPYTWSTVWFPCFRRNFPMASVRFDPMKISSPFRLSLR